MISIRNVEKYFGDTKVLDDVSINIEAGQIYGIVGHSGAGKSTILRCINGLEKYSDGNIEVDSKEVKNLNKSELRELRKDIGMIFQHFSLLERKTVFENVALPMECFGYSKKDIKKRVLELLDLVGIKDKQNQKPKNLSGGQKQRVAIARALTLNPKILLCDEATSALDPKTTQSILKLLRAINQKFGITIVIVTHQMEVVKDICEMTTIMDKGAVVESGKTEDVFLHDTNKIQKLIGEEDIILPEGVNIKLIFNKNNCQDAIITDMARKLDVNISIIYGKLEKFRDNIMGSLIVNMADKDAENVKQYLSKVDVRWEEINNVIE